MPSAYRRLVSNTEALTSPRASDSCYGSLENIVVVAVVILELRLRDVERQVLGRNLVIAANDGKALGFENVLYVEIPTGQVSFHSPVRGAGPNYTKPWDGIKMVGPERISRFINAIMHGMPTERFAPPAEPVQERLLG